MEATPLEHIVQWSGGRLAAGNGRSPVTAICTDSRALKAGEFFLALKGEKFDAHSFLPEAAARGAAGVIAERAPEGLPSGFSVVLVDDTLKALQGIAAGYRRAMGAQVVCITGSNGKTSTKDLTAAVLRERFQVTRTDGNLNNHVGLPLSMLKLRAGDGVGVFEVGMNHPGEIAPLAAIAKPDVAIVTNIGIAHIEYMGSREAIAREKGALAEALGPGGRVILNADDEFSKSIAARTKADAIFCGFSENAQIQATDLNQDFSGMKFRLHAFGRSVNAQLPVPGVHMVSNALLAVAAGCTFGLSLEECVSGLLNLQLSKGRLEQKTIRGVQVLDDSYNANPDSVKAALLTLAQMSANGRRFAVLGRMGELGAESESGHKSVGEAAAKLGIDCVVTIGEEAALIAEEAWRGGVAKVVKAADTDEAVQTLREMVRAGDLVLVKGSRSSRMERIVEGLGTP